MDDRAERIIGHIGAEDIRNKIVAVVVGEYGDVRNSLAAAYPGRHDDVLQPDRWVPGAGNAVPAERVHYVKHTRGDKAIGYDLVLDQPNAVADHAQGDEIILRVRRLRQLHHVEDMAARLIEGFGCGQHILRWKAAWLPPARPQCRSDRCQTRRFVHQTGYEPGSRLVQMRNWVEIRSFAPTPQRNKESVQPSKMIRTWKWHKIATWSTACSLYNAFSSSPSCSVEVPAFRGIDNANGRTAAFLSCHRFVKDLSTVDGGPAGDLSGP